MFNIEELAFLRNYFAPQINEVASFPESREVNEGARIILEGALYIMHKGAWYPEGMLNGITKNISFNDANNNTHAVEIVNGVIKQWTITNTGV